MRLAPLAAALLALAAPAHARPSLEEVAVVRDGLITAAIAYEIGRRCDGIEARTLRGLAFLEGLKGEARRLGYSNAEISAFIEDEAAKDRLETAARALLRDKGAVSGDWASYCAVGRSEIAAGTAIGRLLR